MDTLSNIKINKIIKHHEAHKGLATIALWKNRSNFGLMNISENGKVNSYKEKPILDSWINIGYFYFSGKLVGRIKKFKKFENFLNYLVKSKNLYGYKHRGLHYTVNTEEELNKLTQNIYRFKK